MDGNYSIYSLTLVSSMVFHIFFKLLTADSVIAFVAD